MDDLVQYLPLLSVLILGPVGFLYRQLSKLNEESIEQEGAIDGLKLYVENLDKAMARRSELEVLVARLEAVAHRVERTEASIDKLRNGNHK
jgi:hypothetical protein